MIQLLVNTIIAASIVVGCNQNDTVEVKKTDSAILYLALKESNDTLLDQYFESRRKENLSSCESLSEDDRSLLKYVSNWISENQEREKQQNHESNFKKTSILNNKELLTKFPNIKDLIKPKQLNQGEYFQVNEFINVNEYILADTLMINQLESSCWNNFLVSSKHRKLRLSCIDSVNVLGSKKPVLGISIEERELISKLIAFNGFRRCLNIRKKDKLIASDEVCHEKLRIYDLLSKRLNMSLLHDDNGIHSVNNPELFEIHIGTGLKEVMIFNYEVHPSYPCEKDVYERNGQEIMFIKTINGVTI